MKKVGIITNATRNSGVGSRAYQLYAHMPHAEDLQVVPVMLGGSTNTIEMEGRVIRSISRLPSMLGSKSISWIRLAKHIPTFDIYDLSNQSLSFIARKRQPTIVTVHDLIELTDPQDSYTNLLHRYLLSGITRADKIIAVSEYTKRSIEKYFGTPAGAITVIPNGVHENYAPILHFSSSLAYQQLKQDYKIADRSPIVLAVGSEHPRKNMETTLRVIARVKKEFPHVLLIKVGDPGILSGRAKTLELIDTLGLRAHVLFVGNIPQDRLNELYNLSDALLFPSTNEGFGLPPLEAMAAGCATVTSNAASLPEVLGDAAIMHEAHDVQAFADSIVKIVTDTSFKTSHIEKGIRRAKHFSWKTSAEQMLEVYRSV